VQHDKSRISARQTLVVRLFAERPVSGVAGLGVSADMTPKLASVAPGSSPSPTWEKCTWTHYGLKPANVVSEGPAISKAKRYSFVINHRVAIVDHALRAVFPDAPAQVAPGFQKSYWKRAPMDLGRPLPTLSRLRVRTPKRTIVPLSIDQVDRFWSSFRTSRDLAIVGLLLLQGLRSQEVLDLNRDDVMLPEKQIGVRGKGKKIRFLPLAPEAVQLLDHYLRLERPNPATAPLFVSLKGRARGARMTPAGLRSLFRYHRQTTGVTLANSHPFRHTFASDMLSGGVSLPALMHLMGHAHIQTTLIYVEITPLEVYQQYARAVAQHIRPLPITPP
jgi:integrase